MIQRFNAISFEFMTEMVVFSFSKAKKKSTDVVLTKEDAPLSTAELFDGIDRLYTSFDNDASSDVAGIEVNLNESRHFAINYARHIIRRAGIETGKIVSRNFIRDIDLWLPYKEQKDKSYKNCFACSIKFQDKRISDGFELVISDEGDKRISNTSVSNLPSEASGTYSHVVYAGEKYKFDTNETDAPFWNHLSETYPVLTPKLESILGIPPMPKPGPFENKYLRFTERINLVRSWLLKQELITNVITFKDEGFIKAREEDSFTVPQEAFNLMFENGFTTNDIIDGFKRHGPYKAGKRSLRLIFLYQNDVKSKAARDKYAEYLLSGLKLPSRNGTRQAISPLSQSNKQLAFVNPNDDLVFSSLTEASTEVETQLHHKLGAYGDLSECLVIYVSPISKDSINDPNIDIVYGQLKELFLNAGLSIQGIFADRATKNGVEYSFTNIQAAICAKTFGIPWRIANAREDDLIFGVGAYKSGKTKKKYLGSAFAFDGTGVLKSFSCFQDNTPTELRNNLKEALIKFIDDCQKPPRRIIIHFYKKMNKDEWEPIYKMLKNGLGKDIPVVVVTITLTDSNDMIAFNLQCKDRMPLAGTYLKIGKRTFLLFNNSKYSQEQWDKMNGRRKVHHFPIKISMESRNSDILDDKTAVNEIIIQVFQLSRMYWKSVDQQSIPITVKYPAIIARFLPLFKGETIPNPGYGCKTLWFL